MRKSTEYNQALLSLEPLRIESAKELMATDITFIHLDILTSTDRLYDLPQIPITNKYGIATWHYVYAIENGKLMCFDTEEDKVVEVDPFDGDENGYELTPFLISSLEDNISTPFDDIFVVIGDVEFEDADSYNESYDEADVDDREMFAIWSQSIQTLNKGIRF